MSKILRILFQFVFIGWSSIITTSILFSSIWGGIAWLILGAPSGITVGIIAFIYGLRKGAELEKQQLQNINQFQRKLQSELLIDNEPKLSRESLLISRTRDNEQADKKLGTRTVENGREQTGAISQRPIVDETAYLLDAYEPIEVREGNMAKVYICETQHFQDKNYVAVKVLKGYAPFDLKKIKDWLYECHSWIMLGQHPNIVQIKLIHFGVHAPQVVMEYVENTLEDIKKDFVGDIIKVINIGINICDALIHASCKIPNFVHLDLKPQNILITTDHQAKITDFGIMHSETKADQLRRLSFGTRNFPVSRIKQDLEIESDNPRGTIFYMSPEQIRTPTKVDSRSDIYSVGCILYELFTGNKVFAATAKNKEEYLNCHLTSAPPRIRSSEKKGSDELTSIIHKCLLKQREERYASFSDLRTELARMKERNFHLESLPAIASPANEDAMISMIDALIKLGDYENARQYAGVIKEKLFWKNFFPALCDSYEEKYASSLTRLKSCLEYASSDFEMVLLYKELGFVFEKMGDLDEALRYFNLCIKLDSSLGAVFADVARVKIKNRKFDEAILNYQRSLDLTYDPDILGKYIEFLLDIECFDDAIKELQKALILFVGDMQIHIYLAEAAIGKLVKDVLGNKKSIPEIDKYLAIAKEHSSFALASGFQIDKAKDILLLHDLINGKVI